MNLVMVHFDKIDNEIDFDKFKYVDYGGTSRIYKGSFEGTMHIIKVLTVDHEISVIFRRIKDIKAYIRKVNPPSIIEERTLPIGQGTINSSLLGSSFKDVNTNYPFLFYRYIEGQRLLDAIKDMPPRSLKRLDLVSQLIPLLVILERSGIVHHDLYMENFLIDNQGRLHLIDVESAGVVLSDGTWLWPPLVEGRSGFCKPFEIESGGVSLYFDYWLGLCLIFQIIFGYRPFDFLCRCDPEALQQYIPAVKISEYVWPPQFKKNKDLPKLLNTSSSIEKMRQEIKSNFPDDILFKKFSKLLIDCFIRGYKPNQFHSSFKKNQILLKKIAKELTGFH